MQPETEAIIGFEKILFVSLTNIAIKLTKKMLHEFLYIGNIYIHLGVSNPQIDLEDTNRRYCQVASLSKGHDLRLGKNM